MHRFIYFLGDMISPFAYYQPETGVIIDLRPYIFGGLVVIAGITTLVVMMFRPKKKKQGEEKK